MATDGLVALLELNMWMLSEAPYPQELGLQILSKSQHTIRSLRFVATRGQTPSKIEVFYATTEMQQNCSSGRHDSVSRYFSASFTSCCDPVKWQPPRSFASGCEQRTMRVDLRRCAFLKLLIYPPNVNPNNNSQVLYLASHIECEQPFGDILLTSDNFFPIIGLYPGNRATGGV